MELIQTAGCQFAGGNCDMAAVGAKLEYMVSVFPAPCRCRTEELEANRWRPQDTPSLATWIGVVSTLRSRSPHARSESRLYHFDGAVLPDFAQPHESN